jgi:hypothetical protein
MFLMRSWRRLHNDELRNLYAAPYIFRVIKSRKIGWARHVARMGEMRNVYIFSENLKERDNSEDVSIGGRIILEWILGK